MFKKFLSSKGSATLELTIIFPIILFVLLAIIFFVLLLYQKMVVMDTAIYLARERAATWNNSFKDIETGSLGGSMNNDGLYWRISGDSQGTELVVKKLRNADQYGQTMINAYLLQAQQKDMFSVSFKNQVIKRTVSTSSGALSDISEPVEFIRNWGLGKEYINELAGYLKTFGQRSSPQENLTVVASKNSNVYGQKVYHYPGCKHISKIKQENLVEYESGDLAAKAGFHLCIDCANGKLNSNQSKRANKVSR